MCSVDHAQCDSYLFLNGKSALKEHIERVEEEVENTRLAKGDTCRPTTLLRSIENMHAARQGINYRKLSIKDRQGENARLAEGGGDTGNSADNGKRLSDPKIAEAISTQKTKRDYMSDKNLTRPLERELSLASH
ncbi:hypothetical protein CEXT_577751 [Caerostris extrusa]|uniref:Uncharacterized protein n=1 Tax=Caerostris extrusa TaxID=172846 RepID=A0AAV4SLU8_CAEEX|nr:hypothetical protein CEXT_577751 [Caerostris extrusa]